MREAVRLRSTGHPGALPILAVICLSFTLGATGTIVVLLLLLLLAGVVLARLVTRQFGGQTGDVLGAMEQVGEAAILLVAASLFQMRRRGSRTHPL